VEKPWLQQRKEISPDVLAIIKNARVNGCWIFHEPAKTFYTPKEFEDNWQHVVNDSKHSNNFKDFKIVNPLYAVRLTARWVDLANSKLQDVLKKLEGYTSEFKTK